MKSFFFVLAQLTLVTIVYAFAYRNGYRDAQSKAMSVVRKFANPVSCLLDQLNESIAEAKEEASPTPDIEHSTRNRAGKHLSASGRSKEENNVDL